MRKVWHPLQATLRYATAVLCVSALAGCSYRGPTAYHTAENMADRVGVRKSLANYVVHVESRGNMMARNPASSATGAMQVIDGTAATIAGRAVSREERKTEVGIALGISYLKTCQMAMPYASDQSIWRACYVRGHGSVGGDISHARHSFRQLGY